ncbi:RNA polymerase sigma factor [Streptomyces niveus]|uniref:RNA polymerase sigma factor n=1 Tax=Streptomyces niveus TaxID=193462 RepID=UPI003426B4E0
MNTTYADTATRPRSRACPPAEETRAEETDAGEAHAERDLATALTRGDPDALADAYRRWAPLVHTLATRSLGDAKEAEDITQQVFLGVWRGRAGYRPERGPINAWVVGITRRKIVDALAARTRRTALVTAATAAAGTRVPRPSDHPEAVLDRLLVLRALETLPHAQRRLLSLAFFDDLTQVQIAERTGLPLGTVKSHVRRGLHRLRGALEPEHGAPPASRGTHE